MNDRWSLALLGCCAALVLAFGVPGVSAADDEAKTQDLTFDDIKFDIKKDAPFKREMLTDKIERLSGSPIKIRGYILPSFQQKGIKQFVLVRDNMECCFGPGAALYDCILVEMAPGKSASFTVRPVSVEGRFEISEFIGPDGKHLAIYRMVGEEVK
ncbi:MAG: DUF3299 domain-containing protein [Pirellulaceae bacterium]